MAAYKTDSLINLMRIGRSWRHATARQRPPHRGAARVPPGEITAPRPRAIEYGRYQLIDAAINAIASLGGPWLTLHEVERQLEILSAVDEPNAVRLVQAVAKLAMALSLLAGVDPRTHSPAGRPVTAAANLLGEATTEDPATEVRKILGAPPVAPADVMTIGPLLDELKAAFRVCETSLLRPLMDVPWVMSRFS